MLFGEESSGPCLFRTPIAAIPGLRPSLRQSPPKVTRQASAPTEVPQEKASTPPTARGGAGVSLLWTPPQPKQSAARRNGASPRSSLPSMRLQEATTAAAQQTPQKTSGPASQASTASSANKARGRALQDGLVPEATALVLQRRLSKEQDVPLGIGLGCSSATPSVLQRGGVGGGQDQLSEKPRVRRAASMQELRRPRRVDERLQPSERHLPISPPMRHRHLSPEGPQVQQVEARGRSRDGRPREEGEIESDEEEDEFWTAPVSPTTSGVAFEAAAATRASSPPFDSNDTYGLKRYTTAQRLVHERAIREIMNCKRESCWMWYVLPCPPYVVNGLEKGSANNQKYALRSDEEVSAYLSFRSGGVDLRKNYLEVMGALNSKLSQGILPVERIEVPKIRRSVKLFHRVARNSGDDTLAEACASVLAFLNARRFGGTSTIDRVGFATK